MYQKMLARICIFWYEDENTVGRASRLKKEKKKLLELLAETLAAHPIQTNRQGIWRRIPLIGKPAIGFAVAALGVLAALATFLPRISISTNDPADPTDPFSERFTVTNSGIGTLYDVSASVCPIDITAVPLPPPPLKPLILPCFPIIRRPEWIHHTLERDEQFTVDAKVFGMAKGAKLSGADIAIIVDYRPHFDPFHRRATFRFVTNRLANGNVFWAATPMD